MTSDVTRQDLAKTKHGNGDALSGRLEGITESIKAEHSEFAAMVDRAVAHLASVCLGQSAPMIGAPMPDFALADQDGRLVSLESLTKDGPAVVAFHRGLWCPYSRTNVEALAELDRELAGTGVRIAAITPEIAESNSSLREAAKADFPILTDLDNGYALVLNLAFRVPSELREGMTELGLDLAPAQGNDGWFLPVPATFVIGIDGLIKARFVNPDFRKRIANEKIIDAIRREAVISSR